MAYHEEVVIDNIFCATFLLCGLIPTAITGNGMYGFLGIMLYITLVCTSIYIFEQSKSKAEKKLIANIQCVSKIVNLSSSLESLERSCERLQQNASRNPTVFRPWEECEPLNNSTKILDFSKICLYIF